MALTLSGGTTAGTALPAATIKALGAQRVQFDVAGTYVDGGHAAFATFVKTVLGTRITIIDAIMTKPGGTNHFYYDITNDKLMAYDAANVQVVAGVAVSATNVEMLILFQ